MKLVCIRKQDGITIGKTYELLGCAGEYVVIKDDTGNEYTYLDKNERIPP